MPILHAAASEVAPMLLEDKSLNLLVFETRNNEGFFAILKRGFQHCFFIRAENGYHICIKPTTTRILIEKFDQIRTIDVLTSFASMGCSVVACTSGQVENSNEGFRFSILSCVSVVKRFVGLSRARDLTPWGVWCRSRGER